MNPEENNKKMNNLTGNKSLEEKTDSFSVQQEKYDLNQNQQESDELKESLNAAKNFSFDEVNSFEKQLGDDEEKLKITRPTVRTYRDFAVKALKDRPTSLAKMIIKEKKKEEIKHQYSFKNKKNIFLILLSGILIFLGILAIASVIIFSVNKKNEISEKEKSIAPKSVIYFDYKSEEELDYMERGDIIKLFKNAIEETNIPIGSTKIFYFVKRKDDGYKRLAKVSEFLKVLDTRASTQFIRNLKDEFSVGIISTSEANTPFMVLKITNFDAVYSSILSWEKTMMLDLGDFFNVNKKYYAQKFADISIQNKDVRAIFDEGGKLVFGYSFIDLNTLIFFTEMEAFKKIVLTMQNNRERH